MPDAHPIPRTPDVPLCRNDLLQRVPAVPGATADRQADPALVRRLVRGLDDLPGVLPERPPGRLRLYRLDHPPAGAEETGVAAYRPAGRQPGRAADHRRRLLEAVGRRRPGAAHPRTAAGHDRPALPPAVDHRAAGTGLVRAHLPRCRALPAVRAVEPGLDARPAVLPCRDRAMGEHGRAVMGLVGRLLRVRPAVRGGRGLWPEDQHRCGRSGAGARDVRRRRCVGPATDLGRAADVVRCCCSR